MSPIHRHLLPGFSASLGFALTYLTILVIIPLSACFLTAMSLTWSQFVAVVWTERARSAYALTFGASLIAAFCSVWIGLLIAWVLVRYEFPGKRAMDSLVDLPFALPTAVAGLVFSALYAPNGWLGQFLVPLGIEGAYSRLGIVIVLVFIGFPFVVRTVQPVLESFDSEVEEAAASLGANRWETFRRVLLPALYPALVTGFALSFARGLGEYGSVMLVSGNLRNYTEIAPVLIVESLEESQFKDTGYAEATAIAVVLLVASFVMLLVINWLERWSKRADG